VDENDAVGLALLLIGRGDKKTDVETERSEYQRGTREPGRHFSR
jgi:hypothetical protein